MESIIATIDHGYDPVKVNCVVMRDFNDDEICDFVESTRTNPINVGFIEFMPFDGNVWNVKKLVPYSEMLDIMAARYHSLERIKDHPSDTAKNYRIEGHRVTVSFITSMTEHFCASCDRLRLLADGNFKVCLFGPSEVSLRDPPSCRCRRYRAQGDNWGSGTPSVLSIHSISLLSQSDQLLISSSFV